MALKLLLTGASCAFFIAFQCGAQTNTVPVVTTNWVTAVPYFREVNGKLYNTEKSVLWKDIQGKIIKVLPGKLVVSTFTTEPIYEAVAADKFIPGVPGAPGHHILSPQNVEVGEKNIPGKTVIITNYPTDLFPADGQTISFRALTVGTSTFGNGTLELMDYGTSHVVMVVKTNFPPRYKLETNK